MQKLANAFVKTLHYIHDNKAADIAEKMPRDYYTGDKDLYVRALADGKDMFTADGVMPDQGPETVLQILTASNRALESKKIDLSKTYTTEFVKAVK